MAIRVPGEFHEASSRNFFTKLLHGCCLPDERVHCACPLVFPATPAHCAGTLHWNSALARCTGTLRLPAGPLWPPPITVKRLSCIMPFPLKIITFIIICPSRLKMQKDILRRRCLFCADGETRTHTGQRPLPPQSSVSTISPRPQYFGTAKLRTKIKKQNFFEIFLCIFVELFRKTAKLRRRFIGTHCVTI